MIETVKDSIYFLYILLVILSAYGFLKGNSGLIIFSYLAASFKTNILSDFSDISQYFEPQYIIGLIWLVAIIFKKKQSDQVPMCKTDKYFLGFLILYSFSVIFEPLKEIIVFDSGYNISFKTITKTLIDLLVFYTLILYNRIILISSNYIRNGVLLGVLIIAIQFFIPQSEVAIGINNFQTEEGLRYGGIMKANLNDLAQVMIVPAYFILVLLANNKISKVVGIVTILLISYGVLKTGSRSGLFSLGLIILFLPFSPDIKNNFFFNERRVAYIVLLLGLLLAGDYLLPIFGQTTIRRLKSEKLDENVRMLRYPEYISFFSENPLYLFTGALSEIRGKYSYKYDSHNFYIGKVYIFGVFYLYLFLFFLWKIANSPNKLLKFPVILFMFFGLTGSSPPIGFMLFILYYFSHYFFKNDLEYSLYTQRRNINKTLLQ